MRHQSQSPPAPHELFRYQSCRRAHRHQVAAAEIDAEIFFTPNIKGGRAGKEERERAHAGKKTFAKEINVLRRNQMQHRDALSDVPYRQTNSRKFRPTISAVNKRGQNAERKRDGETL